jgi:hypothetical protein
MTLEKMYRNPLLLGTGYPVLGKNSEVITAGDPVSIDSDGFLIASVAGGKVLGFAIETKTMTSTNSTVALYCPQYIPADGVWMLYQSDQACTQTDIGAYADITGTTGAFYIDLAAGATGQFFVEGFNPDGLGTSYVVVRVAEPQVSAAAQS